MDLRHPASVERDERISVGWFLAGLAAFLVVLAFAAVVVVSRLAV